MHTLVTTQLYISTGNLMLLKNSLIGWIKQRIFFASRGGYEVAAVRTDNGGEFVNSTLHEFFRRRGIEHQMTIPYTSFQDGTVERAHCTIEERTRCLLFGGRVPTTLWTEAVSCAVYLINRLPVSTRSAWEYPLLSLVQCTPSPSSPWTTSAFLDVLWRRDLAYRAPK